MFPRKFISYVPQDLSLLPIQKSPQYPLQYNQLDCVGSILQYAEVERTKKKLKIKNKAWIIRIIEYCWGLGFIGQAERNEITHELKCGVT